MNRKILAVFLLSAVASTAILFQNFSPVTSTEIPLNASPCATTEASLAAAPAEVSAFDSNYFSKRDAYCKEYLNEFNQDQFAAWGFNSWTDSLLNMYEATGNLKYLTEACRLFILALQNRDDQLGRKDSVRGVVAPAWGESYYLPMHTASVVNSALVLAPMLRFRNLAVNNSTFYAQNKDFVDSLLSETLKTFYFFNDQDLETTKTTTGQWEKYYFFPRAFAQASCPPQPPATATTTQINQSYQCWQARYNAGYPLPFNMSLLMGTYALQLFDAEPNASTAAFIITLANGFTVDSGLAANSKISGALTWKYWKPGYWDLVNNQWQNGRPGRPEDISHGSVDLDFMIQYAQRFTKLTALSGAFLPTLTVNQNLMQEFATTFNTAMTKNSGASYLLTDYVDGEYPDVAPDCPSAQKLKASASCANWVKLAAWNPNILKTCSAINFNAQTNQVTACADSKNLSSFILQQSH